MRAVRPITPHDHARVGAITAPLWREAPREPPVIAMLANVLG